MKLSQNYCVRTPGFLAVLVFPLVLSQCSMQNASGDFQSAEGIAQLAELLRDSLKEHTVDVFENSIVVTTRDSFLAATVSHEDGQFGRELYSKEFFEITFEPRWNELDIADRIEHNESIRERILFVEDSVRSKRGGRLRKWDLLDMHKMKCEISDKLLPAPIGSTVSTSVFIGEIESNEFPELIEAVFYRDESYLGASAREFVISQIQHITSESQE